MLARQEPWTDMVTLQKREIYRDERLRRAIASLACVCCGRHGYTQSAHIGGVAEGKGMRLKVSDSLEAALCTVHPEGSFLVDGCHEKFDQYKIDNDRGWEFIAKTYVALIEAGLIRVVK
jgi:hypothetical protein